MRLFIRTLLILAVFSSLAGCAKMNRIANDVDWIVFEGEPSKDN